MAWLPLQHLQPLPTLRSAGQALSRAWCGQARQVILRIELPSREGAAGPPSLVVVRLDHLSYSGAHAQRPACRWCRVCRT